MKTCNHTAKVIMNIESKLVIYMYGNIPAKKNSRRNFGKISLPSKNYTEWHKELEKELGNTKFFYNKFPCKISIMSIVGTKVKSDIDNATSSILDLFTDLGILPDDNRFVVPQISVQNVGYAKNCFITKVVVEPYTENSYEITDDHKGKDLTEFNHYLDGYILKRGDN